MATKKNGLNKQDLAGAQSLAAQIKQQAETGEVDLSLLNQLVSAVEVAVDQQGDAHDEPDGDEAPAAAPSAPTPEPAPAPSAPPDVGNEENMGKIFGTRPPFDVYVPGSYQDELRAGLPAFTKALESGSVRKARSLVGNSQPAFDEAFNMACRKVLDDAGFNSRNIGQIHSMAKGDLDLTKAMTASDLPGVNLMRLARLMLPVYAGLCRRLPAETPENPSNKATWRAYLGFQNLNLANMMNVAEAAIGDAMNETPVEFSAFYRDMSLNDEVNLKATYTSKGYDDPMQVAVIRTLTALLIGRERKVLGDNSAQIAKPTTVTATGSGTGGSLPAATYTVRVSALTYRGWLAVSRGGAGAVGETDATAATNYVATGATSSIAVTWTPVPGAVAYNVFVDNGTNNRWAATVLVPAYSVTAMPGAGNAPSATNVSANPNGYEGLISWCELSTIYSQTIYNKQDVTDLGNTVLSTHASGITQIDGILEALWSDWQIAPTAMLVSPAMSGIITDLLLGLNSANLYRIEISGERGNVAGGAYVSGYQNKYAPYADGTPRIIDIIPHPYMPNSRIEFLCETVPYPMSREARGFALDTLIPFMYFPLAATKLSYPFAVTLSETLEGFHPAVQTALTGIKMATS